MGTAGFEPAIAASVVNKGPATAAVQLIVALLLVPAAICCVAAGMIAGLGGS
jgi:hypothetical protein